MATYRQIRCAAALLIMKKMKKKRVRKVWVREWILRRSQYGAFNNMLQELRIENMDSFQNFCRMSTHDLECLLNLVGQNISKQDTTFRAAIPPKERLLVTLRFLATGKL